MGRAFRPQVENGIYHPFSRGVRKLPIVRDDFDRYKWLSILAYVVERHEWICSAYALLTNHYHLVVQTPHGDISAGMHRLNWHYATYFNRRHGLQGHLFESRFKARLLETDEHLIYANRYVELNPPRAGLCADPADWRWSSHAATVGLAAAPPFLDADSVLRVFSEKRGVAVQFYREFVLEGLAAKRLPAAELAVAL